MLSERELLFHGIPDEQTEDSLPPEKIKRLILCSGQIYYDLATYREKNKRFDVAVARIEQLSPFPFERVIDNIQEYSNLKDIMWCQEEPMNAGAWAYVSDRLLSSLRHLNFYNDIKHPLYSGRDVGASTAVGDPKAHIQELETVLRDAFDLSRVQNSFFEKYVPTAI